MDKFEELAQRCAKGETIDPRQIHEVCNLTGKSRDQFDELVARLFVAKPAPFLRAVPGGFGIHR